MTRVKILTTISILFFLFIQQNTHNGRAMPRTITFIFKHASLLNQDDSTQTAKLNTTWIAMLVVFSKTFLQLKLKALMQMKSHRKV